MIPEDFSLIFVHYTHFFDIQSDNLFIFAA